MSWMTSRAIIGEVLIVRALPSTQVFCSFSMDLWRYFFFTAAHHTSAPYISMYYVCFIYLCISMGQIIILMCF